jgi:hypothetical protein
MFKPLNTLEIYNTIKRDEYAMFDFKGVFAKDQLTFKVTYPSSFVINTHKQKQSGEHWLAVYYNEDGLCTFFDSFGLHPSFYKLENFLNKTSKEWICNQVQLQDINSFTCGYYCIFFILLMSRKLNLENINSLFSKEDFISNDLKILNIYLN